MPCLNHKYEPIPYDVCKRFGGEKSAERQRVLVSPERLELAASAAYRAYGFTSPWTAQHAPHGVAQPDTKEKFREVVRAVLFALNAEDAE